MKLEKNITIESLREDRTDKVNKRAEEICNRVLSLIEMDNNKGATSAVYKISSDDLYCTEEVVKKLRENNFYSEIKIYEKVFSPAEINLSVRWDYSYKDIILKRKRDKAVSILTVTMAALLLFITLLSLITLC